MRILLISALAGSLLAAPVLADEFTDSMALALEAYNNGDINTTKEELDFADQILQGMLADAFQAYLPEAQAGWTREIEEGNSGAALVAFGGGVMAKADYSNGGQSYEVTMMANNNLVASMTGMLSNTTMMAMIGKIVRVGSLKFVEQDGEVQGLVGGVLIQVSGEISVEDKIAIIESMDLDTLADY